MRTARYSNFLFSPAWGEKEVPELYKELGWTTSMVVEEAEFVAYECTCTWILHHSRHAHGMTQKMG